MRIDPGSPAIQQSDTLFRRNYNFAIDLARLMTEQGMLLAVGIGCQWNHWPNGTRDISDLHVADNDCCSLDPWEVREILSLASDLTNLANVQVVLSDELPGAAPPRKEKASGE